ncbi:MAG TPA: hypothetical protein VKY19_10135 [Ktedonosporobacter sp.]|jgi:hypothetical protein|nr:hypothetical protein [Ktedonosporobacter sp.]
MATVPPFKLGNATILVENGDFAEGYNNGFVGHLENEDCPITVEEIRQIIETNLSDPSASPVWNTGYIVGALINLYAGSCRSDEPDAPHVELGPTVLRLDRWRFREGYYTGQQEYQVRRAERTDPHEITVRELLDMIAHRDPATQTYHFDAEQLTCLENVLGELVGYLCTALFSETQKEPTTGPLAVVAS